MSITRTITVTEEERTYRADIVTPFGGEYLVNVYRETLRRDANRKVFTREKSETPIVRKAVDVARETVTLTDKTVISVAQISEALPLLFDRWATEDAA
jgi:hypothetical protein